MILTLTLSRGKFINAKYVHAHAVANTVTSQPESELTKFHRPESDLAKMAHSDRLQLRLWIPDHDYPYALIIVMLQLGRVIQTTTCHRAMVSGTSQVWTPNGRYARRRPLGISERYHTERGHHCPVFTVSVIHTGGITNESIFISVKSTNKQEQGYSIEWRFHVKKRRKFL